MYDDVLVGIPGEDIGCPALSTPQEAEGLHYHFPPYSLKTESLTESSEARLVAGKPHQYSHLYISQHWGYRHTHDLAQLFHGSAVLNSGPHVCSKWFNQLNHMLSSTSH